MKKILLFLLLCSLFTGSCSKDNIAGDYTALKEGIVANSIEKVQLAINNIISRLPDKEYTSANLSALIQKISSAHGLSCEVVCFDCIQTMPGQSEIKIRLEPGGGSVIERIIDISYTQANVMIFVNMHE